MLRINEIFYSIQGEGRMIGFPMVFIRLHGCNLGCEFCDTKYSWDGKYKEMEEGNIVTEIEKYGCNNICITGGEPFMQPIQHLIQMLRIKNYWIMVETNGTYPVCSGFDHVVVSPKIKNDRYYIHSDALKQADELKYVITCQSDLDKIEDAPYYITLQPVDNNPEIAQLCLEVMKRKSCNEWRLIIQSHKIFNLK